MELDKCKKQVNLDQLNGLIKFLKQHQELAKGLSRGRRGKFNTVKLWNLCAKTLNDIHDGAVKDGRGWSKYWCDWKYRVRRRALELKAAKDNNNPLPENFTSLSQMEEEILSIIGENSLDAVIIKSDPLARESDGDFDATESIDTVSVLNYTESKPTRKKRRCSSKDFIEVNKSGESSKVSDGKKPKTGMHRDDSDQDSTTQEFLNLEKEKLENTKKIQDSLHTIATQVTRLTDIMEDIKNVVVNNPVNI